MAANPKPRVCRELLIPKNLNNVRKMMISSSPDRNHMEPLKKCNQISGENLTSPDRTQVLIESKPKMIKAIKISVLYYLSRNGHLEHPHLIQVSLASPQGLYLRDVMNSLNLHRGKGMANMYSWSSKRSYKNGFVWHDVSEDDLIHPTIGHDYILKGTELLQTTSPELRSYETNSTVNNINTFEEDCKSTAATIRTRNQSWSSFDNPQEYIVYKCESSRDFAAKFVATQTEEKTREKDHVELSSREEIISPPQSNSSEDGSEGLREIDRSGEIRDRTTAKEDRYPSGRTKASKVLMQLISCGATSVKGVDRAGPYEFEAQSNF